MENKIPQINQDFDLRLLLHVLGKNIIWILFLFVIGLSSAFLLIRYTKPVYKTKSVIQLTGENEQPEKNIFAESLSNPYASSNLAKEIELLRSPVFLKRVAESLPLGVNYYSKGAILNFELYRSTPFFVEYENITNLNYGKKYDVDFFSETQYHISIQGSGNKSNKQLFNFGEWVSYDQMNIKISKNEAKKQVALNEENFYFTIVNPQVNLVEIINSLNVRVLNEAAKTIEISYTGYNPVKVAEIANGIAKEFEFFNLEKKQESSNKLLAYIDKTLGIVTTGLSENEKELLKFNKGESIDPFYAQIQYSGLFQKEVKFEEAQRTLLYDIDVLKKIKSYKINNKADLVVVSANLSGTGVGSALTPYLGKFEQLFNQVEEMQYTAPENSPVYRKMIYMIEQHKISWNAAIDAMIGVTQERIQELMKSRPVLMMGGTSSLDTINLNYNILKRIKDINEKFFNQLVQKKAEYTIAREGFTPEYQILEYAAVPESPISPDKKIILISALAAWFLLSVLLVGIRYILTDEILLVNDISKYTSSPILGMIHKYKEDIPVSQLIVDKKTKGLIAEAFRSVRTNLQFIYNEEGPKVITLTSTISGEGKTFVSMNLAGILAFSGSKVIILDCDMRKPKIHQGFQVDNELGMSTILIGKTSINECIRKSSMENLDFITAGPIPPNPAELLLNKKMEDTIKELKKEYDYVVIDNPPVGLVSDAIVNLQRADYPIYIFRSDYSRKFFINNLNRLKEENKISNISCILNSVDLAKNKSYGYGYGYGTYNYGYGYGYGFGYYEEESGVNTQSSKISSAILTFLKGKGGNKNAN